LLLLALFEFSNADFTKAIRLNKRAKIPAHIPTLLPGQDAKAIAKEHVGCELCIDFWNQVLSNLIQIIGDIGIGGGCSAICGELPQQWEQDVCLLLCQIEGSGYFSELVNDLDPDPIWNCMELYVCPWALGVNGSVTSVNINPINGPVGGSYTITGNYKLFSTTGTGQVLIWVVAPDDFFEFGWAETIYAQTPGTYPVSETFESQPTEEAPFIDGTYTVFIQVCEGTCGGIHSGEYQIAIGANLFNMTN